MQSSEAAGLGITADGIQAHRCGEEAAPDLDSINAGSIAGSRPQGTEREVHPSFVAVQLKRQAEDARVQSQMAAGFGGEAGGSQTGKCGTAHPPLSAAAGLVGVLEPLGFSLGGHLSVVADQLQQQTDLILAQWVHKLKLIRGLRNILGTPRTSISILPVRSIRTK